MTLEILSNHTVNKSVILDGRVLDLLDFGEIHRNLVESNDMKSSEVYFKRRIPNDGVLLKYGINSEEYDSICKTLEKEIQSVVF